MKNTVSNAMLSTCDALKVENVSEKAIETLRNFRAHLESLGENASRHTHYNRLDEWSKSMHQFVRDALYAFGFTNGEQELNDKIPDVKFWWDIYGICLNITYSRHLTSAVSNHHSSAFERNEAIKAEIDTILSYR